MFARKHFYVYTLAYPDGTVFYVGKGRKVPQEPAGSDRGS